MEQLPDYCSGEFLRHPITPEQSEAALEYLLRVAIQKDPTFLDRFTELEQAVAKQPSS